MTSGLALRSKRHFKRDKTSAKAGISDVDSSTARAFRPEIGSTLSQPRWFSTEAVRK